MTTVNGTPSASGLRALIVTIYGLYAREVGGWLGVRTIIAMMAELGVDEPAVRSSISRLKRRGILEAQRQDGRAGYALSPQARAILDEGDRRIFGRRRATLEEGWLLAVFSVPESERAQRHTLRSRLTWLGFGTVGPGVWIAPAHLEDEARQTLLRHGLQDYVDLFAATYLGFPQVAAEVAHWWDLPELDRNHYSFCEQFASLTDRSPQQGDTGDGAAFADYVRVLTAWRRLPYLDPGLAPELLPPDWSGARAAELFFTLHARLAEPAHRFVAGLRG